MNALIAFCELFMFVGVCLPVVVPLTFWIMKTEWGKKFFDIDDEGGDDDE